MPKITKLQLLLIFTCCLVSTLEGGGGDGGKSYSQKGADTPRKLKTLVDVDEWDDTRLMPLMMMNDGGLIQCSSPALLIVAALGVVYFVMGTSSSPPQLMV